MNIKLTTPYKSLSEFEASGLANFCIITGRNGSGKTQLVELIELLRQGQNNNIQIDADRMKIQVGNMNHQGPSQLDPGAWNSQIGEFYSTYTSKLQLLPAIQKIFDSKEGFSLLTISEPELYKVLGLAISELRKGLDSINYFSHPSQTPDKHYIDVATQEIFDKRVSFEIAWMVSLKAKKNLLGIGYQDFMRFPPEEHFIDKRHLFFSSIEMIFYAYARRRHLNHLNWFANKEYGKEYDCLSDQKFNEKFPAPWSTINKIFKKHGINYSFQEILPESFVENIPIDFRLIKNSNGSKIEFAGLSSGEKIIIALIVKLFTSEYYSKNLELPELVVLDEPDAFLHPELSKLLIEVLHQTFVKDLGIKVLMTTHSPSTVALAPEESIYELKNDPKTSLNKISKDDALKILTFGVPTLSVDYRNHKQVFVESSTDVFYYQTIADVLSQKESLTFKLYFISYSKGKGSCDQVIKIVKDFRGAGNDKVFGIIDWDNKNKSEENIYVHGEGVRYSIENFLYDPIYLVELFLDIEAENVNSELKFQAGYRHYDIGINEPEDRLQEIADWVILKIIGKFPGLKSKDNTRLKVKFNNEKTVMLPTWYVQSSGHELEEKLKATFLSLAGKFRNEGELQEALTIIIAKSYPFWPKETVDLLKKISIVD